MSGSGKKKRKQEKKNTLSSAAPADRTGVVDAAAVVVDVDVTPAMSQVVCQAAGEMAAA